MTFSLSAGADIEPSKTKYFDGLIAEAEKQRLTGPDILNKNLAELMENSSLLNEVQTCHVDFLNGYQLAYKGLYEKLDKYLASQLEKYTFPEIQIRLYSLRANILVISGKFELGLENLDRAFRLIEAVNNNKILNYVYSAAGIVYDSINQPELSIKYAELTNEVNPSPQNLCKANYFIYKRDVEDINNRVDNVEIEAAIKQCKASDLPIQSLFLEFYFLKHQIDATYNNNYQLQNIADSLALLEELVSQTNYPNIQSFYWAMVAYTQEKLGNFDSAENTANLSLEINKGFGDTEQKIIALEVKLQVALQKANDDEAYQLLKERTESEQRRFNDKQAKLAAFMKVKHDNLAKTHEISMLNQKNKMLEMKQVIAAQNDSNQRLLVLLLAVLLVFFVLWVWRAHKRQVELKKLSESDHLTQVLNRQGLEAQVSNFLDVAEENNQTVHMAILDLDHFKKINDNYGHLTGDWVLKHVVKACKETLKSNMLMGRLGGEEFAIWLFDYSVKEAKDHFELTRNQVASLDCKASGHDINVTASLGVANSINSGYNITQLLKNSDIALYQAKSSGRNKVVVYQYEIN